MLALQAYGPTEAAVCAMMACAGLGWQPGLLGRPLPHQRVLLSTDHGLYRILPLYPDATPRQVDLFNAVRAVKEDGMDADTGLEGEIWLAGEAVSPGYLDEPEAGRRRFGLLQDGMRVHYTGDLAHLRSGRLCWTGRLDRQLKINGRMVCPEEVEMAAGAFWHGPCACVHHDGHLVLALGDTAQEENCIEPGEVDRCILQTLGTAFRVTAVRIGAWPISSSGKTDLSTVLARLEALSAGDRH
jgi:acyl-CoA synthetase (AMP-forming)/AMP-acid ligase II